MTYSHFVGIDIGAYQAHIHVFQGSHFSIQQGASGYQMLDQQLCSLNAVPQDILVVMEATGVYWLPLAQALYQKGYAVSVINPAQSHYFAKALLKRSKSDPIDAQILAQLASHLPQPALWEPDGLTYDSLQQTLQQRDATLQMLYQTQNRLHALSYRLHVDQIVLARYHAQAALFQAQVRASAADLKASAFSNPLWKTNWLFLDSIPGFGPVVISWLLVATRNFTSCSSPEQLVSYAGLCPRLFDSGSSIHRRPSLGFAPHSRLRQALYMASLSAVQHNPIIRDFYHHLLDQGKPKKVALCACARKLIHIAWALVLNQTYFDPAFS